MAPERTGFVLPPDPAAFAATLDRLAEAPRLAEEMGRAAKAYASDHDWDHVVPKLLV